MSGEVGGVCLCEMAEHKPAGWLFMFCSMHVHIAELPEAFLFPCVVCDVSSSDWSELVISTGEKLRFVFIGEVFPGVIGNSVCGWFMSSWAEGEKDGGGWRWRRLSLFTSCWRCVSSWWPACRRKGLCWCLPWRGNQSKDRDEINNKATWEEGLKHLWYGNVGTFIQTPA